MRPLFQHASRTIVDFAALIAAKRAGPGYPSNAFLTELSRSSTVCVQCQFSVLSSRQFGTSRKSSSQLQPSFLTNVRSWSSSRPRPQERPPPREDPLPSREEQPLLQEEKLPQSDAPDPSVPPREDLHPPTTPEPPIVDAEAVRRVPDEELPSHREKTRWDISKRFSRLMDELLPRLATVGQKVNTFTGTDYSGIEALRREIKEQEQLVKSRRLAVKDAKERLDAAHAQQASSQKEVVGLLERKHSWLAADLERYMSLIRSEHVNDQAVQAAKDAVQAADASLEEARARLEKRERAQYHEEQIWSDTIRRNSTWVTIGLMGFNTFLLLVSLAIFEPWRRRRIVREIKGALDEKTTAATLAPAAAVPTAVEVATPQIEAEIDTIVEPAGVTLERIEDPALQDEQPAAQVSKNDADVPLESPLVQPAVAEGFQETSDLPLPEQPVPEAAVGEAFPAQPTPSSWSDTWESYKVHFRDLFSERHVTVRKVDVTTVALEGVAAGAAFVGLVVVLLRPK